MHVQSSTISDTGTRSSAARMDANGCGLGDAALSPHAAEFETWSAAPAGEAAAVAALRRVVEVTVAVMALAVAWPVMLAVALIVKLDTPGPALFRQTRVGLNGRLFRFYKFRTLYADSRQRFPELYTYKYTPEQIRSLRFKREVDPRITPAGQWLRKSTLDELPNFWNLLKGDIALVGPRPEIPEMVPHYLPAQLRKFSVKPGITGLAQTHGRGKLSFQDTIAYDLEYVRRRSVLLDMQLIFRTVRMLLKLDGAF
jgi:lipopolysaccharide/colanic/teichoic acid biosynthesis glycosyltransferase